MTVFWPSRERARSVTVPPATGHPVTLGGEAISTAYDHVVLESLSGSLPEAIRSRYETYIDEIERRTGTRLANPLAGPVDLPSVDGTLGTFARELGSLRETHPDLPPAPDPDEVIRAHIAEAAELRARYDDMRARMTVGGSLAAMLGEMGAYVQEPLVLASLPFGAAAASGILRTALIEALIAAGVDIPLQAQVLQDKRLIGSPYELSDAALAVILTAAGSGTLAGMIKGAERGGRHLLEAYRRVHEGPGAVRPPTAEEQVAMRVLERELDTADESPFPRTPEGEAAHIEALSEALTRAEGRPPEAPGAAPAEPAAPAPAPTRPEPRPDVPRTSLARLDPDEIGVDAQTFQFKSGGDEAGVTDRLAGVERFDERLAGVVMVYEYADGRMFIADGHQRLGLARRAKAAGQEDVGLHAFILRETDGVSPSDARAIAATKNIAEGTGTAIDAAKVLREVGEAGLPPLPPRSALVRDARGLEALGDDAFGMVVNELVPPAHAAIVGRLVQDPEFQVAVLGLLARTKPDTATQVEQMVRDALHAGASRQRQETLFGEELITETLVVERARVFDAALQRIKRDRRLFATLVRDSTAAEEAGNVLARETNAQRLTDDQQLIETVGRLAARTGAVSDALTAAARSIKDGSASLAAAAGEFIGHVRRALHEELAARPDAGRAGPGGPDLRAAPGRSATQEARLAQSEAEAARLDRLEADQADAALEAAARRELDALEATAGEGVEVPIGERIDPETGQRIAETRTARELFDDADEARRAADEAKSCNLSPPEPGT